MNARMRRIASDWEQLQKDFGNHPYIKVTPMGPEPPERYHVTYFVNGIYLLPDGSIQTLARHDVEITLHADYPRYKPLCRILTPIWHPNFRDGQICIGDIWGAGESLSDIIINIGDMIQYKSWNSYSPLSADAAKWAIEHKHMFPVGNLNLYPGEDAAPEDVQIDLFDEQGEKIEEEVPELEISPEPENDFEITAEELAGVTFVPTAARMQSAQRPVSAGKKLNFKTVFMKGLLWGLIGGIIGFALQELIGLWLNTDTFLGWMGYPGVEEIYANAYAGLYSDSQLAAIFSAIGNANRLDSAFFSAFMTCGIGLFLGLGEGIYYGSGRQAAKNAAIGAGISLVLGFVSGYIAQWLYSTLMRNTENELAMAFIRGICWAIAGLGIGFSAGLLKPEKKRMLFCMLGGLVGGFIGGFAFNYIFNIPWLILGEADNGIIPRAVGITATGLLVGLGVGLLEQFAKSAWLKVIRGEFEGKEYLVFAGTTSIGNNGKNTIVLFKDKLVGEHHCDIIQEGNRYVLVDCGTPLGTVVNGMRVSRHVLRQGDAIAIGNSVLVFNMK